MRLYKEYDEDTLKKLQKVSLDILLDFDEFCNNNDIDYFGCGGTAIGAVRHGGFIPWDDDIDVGMTRKNYDKFVELSYKLNDKYKFISYENTTNFPLMTGRLALKGTKFKEECFRDLDFDNGIFLDIFCFDNIFDDDRKMRRQMLSAWLWGKLLILWYISDPVIYYTGFKAKLIKICCRIAHAFLRLVYRSSKPLYSRAHKYATCLRGKKTERVAYIFDPTPYTSIMRLSDIEPTKVLEFEGKEIRFPCNVEAYLKVRYGDNYMSLPPEDKRHNHPPYELEFPREHEKCT